VVGALDADSSGSDATAECLSFHATADNRHLVRALLHCMNINLARAVLKYNKVIDHPDLHDHNSGAYPNH